MSALLVACSSSDDVTESSLGGNPVPTPHAQEDGGTDVEVEDEGFCARIAGGAGTSERDPAVALSLAHADVRYFGVEATHAGIDGALVRAIADADDRVDVVAAGGFGRALESACFVEAGRTTLGDAAVTLRGSIAVVRPGLGDVILPDEATAAELDLRDVPDGALAEEAIVRAAGALLDAPLPALAKTMHERTGFTDEVFAEQNLYRDALRTVPLEGPPPRASRRVPLAVVIGPRVAPAAARMAAHLRATGRAWLLGDALPVAVAETRWAPISETRGLAWRAIELSDANGRLPDLLEADGAADDTTFVAAGEPPAIGRVASRQGIAERRDFGVVQRQPLSVAVARAALLSAHGAVKRFFPYFGTRQDVTDARLHETLEAAKDVATRNDLRMLLRRFGNAITDGHNWVIDLETPSRSVLPVVFDRVDGGIVVTRSYDAAFRPGDVAVSFDGTPADAWFSRETERTYGATEGFRFFTAMQELTTASIPRSVVVRGSNGATRTVTTSPISNSGLAPSADLFAGSLRHRGFLADLGAPDVYYMNLDGRYVLGDDDVRAGLTEAAGARALVLDMRGHPANGSTFWNPYELLQRLIPASFSSPRYRVPVIAGDGAVSDAHPYEDTYTPLDAPSFRGRILFIVDHQAVSFAEDFSLMLVGARRATVIGRPSAGTTGSVSGMQLPGSFSFFFTGMEARWPDGRVHFGQGIVPDVVVTPKVDDYVSGRDPFLAAAIEELRR